MRLRVKCPQCRRAYQVRDQAAGMEFHCKVCLAAIEAPSANLFEAANSLEDALAEESPSAPTRRLSWINEFQSFGGSLVFHTSFLLLLMSWIVSTQTDLLAPDLMITTTDSDPDTLEPLENVQVLLELPGEPIENKMQAQELFTQVWDDQFELPEISLPDLPSVPESDRAVQDRSPKRKRTKKTRSPNQTVASRSAVIEKEVQQRVDRAGGKSGAIQISLIWNNGNDLDLYVQTPTRDIIAFNYKRSRCGGELDVDMNAKKTQSLKPVENVFWSAKRAPRGVFVVGVNEYQNHGYRDPTRFLVSLKVDGEVHHFRGTTRSRRPVQGICKFERNAKGVKFLETPKTIAGNKKGKTVRK